MGIRGFLSVFFFKPWLNLNTATKSNEDINEYVKDDEYGSEGIVPVSFNTRQRFAGGKELVNLKKKHRLCIKNIAGRDKFSQQCIYYVECWKSLTVTGVGDLFLNSAMLEEKNCRHRCFAAAGR